MAVTGTGDLQVDYASLNAGPNAGGYSPAIRFGVGNTGEGIASDRTGTVNPEGIDFYTDFTPRLSVTNGGYIGIGTTAPANQLEVHAQASPANAIEAVGFAGPNGSNLAGSVGLVATGGAADPTSESEGAAGLTATGGVGGANFGGDGPGGIFTGGDYLAFSDGRCAGSLSTECLALGYVCRSLAPV